uniref:Kinesin-like protein n=1 Tax=Tanacetum cinerariifolium TaxID=118510 RepID=A0A6L2NHH5_TANCI|nr:kinesin-like protein [Tanacetum cinerariifolium]
MKNRSEKKGNREDAENGRVHGYYRSLILYCENHIVVMVEYGVKDESNNVLNRIGKLSLIDLAGLERAIATDQRTLRSLEVYGIDQYMRVSVREMGKRKEMHGIDNEVGEVDGLGRYKDLDGKNLMVSSYQVRGNDEDEIEELVKKYMKQCKHNKKPFPIE